MSASASPSASIFVGLNAAHDAIKIAIDAFVAVLNTNGLSQDSDVLSSIKTCNDFYRFLGLVLNSYITMKEATDKTTVKPTIGHDGILEVEDEKDITFACARLVAEERFYTTCCCFKKILGVTRTNIIVVARNNRNNANILAAANTLEKCRHDAVMSVINALISVDYIHPQMTENVNRIKADKSSFFPTPSPSAA